MTWKCFVALQTQSARQTLRRYHSGEDLPCTGSHSFHNAQVRIGLLFPWVSPRVGGTQEHSHEDPRWPTHCSCGYQFTDKDSWQYKLDRIFTRDDHSGEFTLFDLPIGAIIEVPWMLEGYLPPTAADIAAGKRLGLLSVHYWRDWYTKRVPLTVQCPGRVAGWCVDQKSNNGDGWGVTGTAPLLTASPSIRMADYHGFLRDGVLTDDLEGRTYGPSGLLS